MRPILLVLLTCGFFASTDIVARLVAETQAGNTIHPLVITFGRYVAGFLLTAPVLLTRFGNIRSQVPYLYLLRSGGGVTSATCIFIGVYTAVLLFGVKRLSEGEVAYQGFLDALDHPLFVLFHLLALAFSAYNSITWFGVTPKAIRIQIGENFAPEGVVAGVHYAGWIAISLVVLFMAGI